MKTVLLFCFLFLTLQTFTQEKVKAVKFDEYSEKEKGDLKLLEQKVKRFSRTLRNDKSSQGLIFIYHSISAAKNSCQPYRTISDYFAPRNAILERRLKTQKQRVVNQKAGGFRDYFAIEFWIIPMGSENPKPTSVYEYYDFGVCCPSIEINFDGANNKNKIVLLTAELSGGNSASEEPKFQWKTSEGNIISGQGTKQIKVDISKVISKEIVATVELVQGVSDVCQRSISNKINIQQTKPK